ncbi:MAG: hypothetical protein ACRENC_19450 [Gemmatimonadaceae bacterium]
MPNDQPALSDGGPRAAPAPSLPGPLAYAIVLGLVLVGATIGVVALIVIRRWDRSRPIERETESVHPEEQHPTYEKRSASSHHV